MLALTRVRPEDNVHISRGLRSTYCGPQKCDWAIESGEYPCDDCQVVSILRQLSKLSITLQVLASDCVSFCAVGLRSRTALAAGNLFLRKQLALFQEREKKAAPTTAADRFVLSKLARFFDWRSALVIVKPATLIGWHRVAFRRFWHWKSRPVERRPVSAEVRRLIRRMAVENLTWGEERIEMNFGSSSRFVSFRQGCVNYRQ